MSTNTNIEWTDATWNPIRGCSRVSEGCRNCYAERQAIRQSGPGQAYDGLVKVHAVGDKREPRWTGKVIFDEEKLQEPLHWKKPKRVFVNSMSDLFHEEMYGAWLDKIFAMMAVCPQHTFQILTKRPEIMNGYIHQLYKSIEPLEKAARGFGYTFNFQKIPLLSRPIPNIWLGVSVENQDTADDRIPALLDTMAAVRWVSYEPALEAVNFSPWVNKGTHSESHLDWIVCGGESGPDARPFDLDWGYNVRTQCKAADVPFFMKQLGSVPMESEEHWRGRVVTRLLSAKNRNRVPSGFVPLKFQDKKGGDPAEWPEDLRVREYPERSK